ncbi:hypothetical protein [Erythrobacter sp.]|uniref:hypothetical protein n=1 Tax=Erythrobacter sp. TaxID=1042 RepID=UPI00311FB2C2
MKSAIFYVALASIPAQASGPVSILTLQSGSQGVLRSGTSSLPPVARDPAEIAYSKGKTLVSKRISCKTCAHPKGVKDAQTAQQVAQRVRTGEYELDAKERELVLFYLTNRFGA